MEPILVLTTTGTKSEAEELAKLLLEHRKVACVQIDGPINSYYHWKGKIEASKEYRLCAKTISQNFIDIGAIIEENHSYETPEIIALPITQISDDYKKWMSEEITRLM